MSIAAVKLQSFVKKSPKEAAIKTEIKDVIYNPVSEIENTLGKIDTFLVANLKESGTVGAAAVITYKGEIAYVKTWGKRKSGETEPVDKNTVFRLASVSKPITGVLAGILHEEKTINLEDKVSKYLPEVQLKDSLNTNNLKIKHLLSHTSGLIPHTYDLMVEDKVPLKTIIGKLKEVDISAPPGQLYAYQNVMYSIYDPVLQKITGESFSDVLQKKVFNPFHMYDASTGFNAFKRNDNKAFPHVNRGNNRYIPIKLNNRYYNTIPAAGINASISDLGNLLKVLSNSDSEIISDEVLQILFTPQIVSPLKRTYFRSWGKLGTKHYGVGWRIVNYKNRKVAYHGGYVTGYKAEIAVCPEEEIGIAILSNSPNQITARNMPYILNNLFEQKEKIVQENSEKQMVNSEP